MFRYKSNINNLFQTQTPIPDCAITNGTAIQDGTAVRFANGRVSIATAGTVVGGLARIYDGTIHTGNAGGTITCDVEILRPGDIWEVTQDAIADAACQAGDLLDIDATGLVLAAAGNNDLTVIHHDVINHMVDVMPVLHQFL